jgi:hypothetical protein
VEKKNEKEKQKEIKKIAHRMDFQTAKRNKIK